MRDRAAGDGPAGGAGTCRSIVAIGDVVEGAARAAHHDGADGEEDQQRRLGHSPGAAASAMDHQPGKSSSQVPIGRSSRARRQ